jgi:hypothetical protein
VTVRLALGFGLGIGAIVLAWYAYMTWRAREVARGTLGAKPALDPLGLFTPTAPTIPGIVPLPDGLTRPPVLTYFHPTAAPVQLIPPTNPAALAGARLLRERSITGIGSVSMTLPDFGTSIEPVTGVLGSFPRLY